MHFILGVVIGFIAAWPFGIGGVVLGALIGVLAAEVFNLRKRVNVLEKSPIAKQPSEKCIPEEVVFQPAAAEPTVPKQALHSKTIKSSQTATPGRESESMGAGRTGFTSRHFFRQHWQQCDKSLRKNQLFFCQRQPGAEDWRYHYFFWDGLPVEICRPAQYDSH